MKIGNLNSDKHNSDNCNSGDKNSGYGNSGNKNSGNYNRGNENSGHGNRGNKNSGVKNSGDKNSGDWNIGDENSGNRNRGNKNSGDWNKTNFSNGCFNTVEPKIYMFNKPSEWTFKDWQSSRASALMDTIPTSLRWIDFNSMTDEEKLDRQEAKITGGYLKKYTDAEQEERANVWWQGLSTEDKSAILSIPNFDKEIFKEITGIDVDRNGDGPNTETSLKKMNF